jgi:fructosamine-3-kinase
MLGGGVSADIWRVDLSHETVVVKQARSSFKVEADWQVDPDRVLSEIAWHNFVASFLPDSVPKVIAVAPKYHAFSMAMLDYPLWKAELLKGQIKPEFAQQVAHQLASIHSRSTTRSEVREQFAYDDLFVAQRIEPYFLTTANKNVEIRDPLTEMGNNLLVTKRALMHGDISPKNILIGTAGPIFLDAETTCYGDPAFDMAFCLTHLMLKALLHPENLPLLMASVRIMLSTYLASVDWEDGGQLAKRITKLLQAIMLARVDGKSPVEYLATRQQALVRNFCVISIQDGVAEMDRLIHDWTREISA